MGGDSEYEPNDSRNVTGTARTPDGRWSGDKQKPGHGGEYEPRDSRNVTGTSSTQDGRWTNVEGEPPLEAGGHETPPTPEEVVGKEEDEPVEFQPDPALDKVRDKQSH